MSLNNNMQDLGKKTRKSDLFGEVNDRVANFDDLTEYSKKGCPAVKQIKVRTGALVDSLAFVYEGGIFKHGGSGGSESTFNLEKGELITKVRGGKSEWNGYHAIGWLEFTTNKGRFFNAGSPGVVSFQFTAEKGGSISCLFGLSGHFLDLIGFYEIPDFKAEEYSDMGAVPGTDRLPDTGSMPGVGKMFGK